MTEEEMNAYRFSPYQEPTDEMLAQIMREVAQEARESNRKVTEDYFAQMRRNAEAKKALWRDRINAIRANAQK